MRYKKLEDPIFHLEMELDYAIRYLEGREEISKIRDRCLSIVESLDKQGQGQRMTARDADRLAKRADTALYIPTLKVRGR